MPSLPVASNMISLLSILSDFVIFRTMLQGSDMFVPVQATHKGVLVSEQATLNAN